MYLTRDELAQLLGCAPQSYVTMARRLKALGIPHLVVPGMCPRVLPDVFDDIVNGRRPPVPSGIVALQAYQEKRVPSIPDLWKRYSEGVAENGFGVKEFNREDALPTATCIYLMIRDGRVRYVGQTKNLAMRAQYHRHQWWKRIAIIEAPEWWPWNEIDHWLVGMETSAISRFKPPENIAMVPCAYRPDDLSSHFDALAKNGLHHAAMSELG